jgi:gluconate kinase
MIVVLFGLLGCGKNYVGKIFEEFGFHFYDADQDLTPMMKNAILNHQVFTDEMRDEYFDIVISRIAELKECHKDLVVAQALFKNKHRQKILKAFPDAQFIWIQSALELISERLTARANHIAGKSYGELVNSHFETPTIPCEILMNNDGREEVLDQIKSILKKAKRSMSSDR